MNEGRNVYVDRKFKGTREEYFDLLNNTKTLYVTNLPLHLTEERLWNIFAVCGKVENVVRGVNDDLEFVGFAFIIYQEKEGAQNAFDNLHIKIDTFSIKIDKDVGFSEERRFGRGKKGQQLKNDFKKRQR